MKSLCFLFNFTSSVPFSKLYIGRHGERWALYNFGNKRVTCNPLKTTIMKITFTYLTLALLVFACSDKQTKQTNSNKNSREATQQATIKGTWTIKKYFFSDISAMDEKTAGEWLNKSVRIDDKLHFDFQKITSYKDMFNNENDCPVINMDKPEVVTTDYYFDTIRDPLTELKINKLTINIYKTTCKDNPFSEFVINEEEEIIFRWDGAFFIMTKE